MCHVTPWLAVVLVCLATYRLTILVTEDKITRPLIDPIQEWAERRWLAKHPNGDRNSDQWQSQVGWLLSCPWCSGLWIAGIVTCVVDVWFAPLPMPVLVALAASGVTGFLATMADAAKAVD